MATFGMARVALAVADSSNACGKDIMLQVPIPGLGWCVKGFPEYLQAIYNLFVGISGILAVIMIMFGGFQWLIAGGNPSKITGAKATILSAMAGLTLLLASYTILNVINPKLTSLDLDIASYKVDAAKTITAVSGFCASTSKVKEVSKPQDMKCGTTYTLEDGTGTCLGAWCDNDMFKANVLDKLDTAVTQALSLGDVYGVCINSSCQYKLDLSKAKDQGYDDLEMEAYIMRTYGTGGGSDLECGKIYYRESLPLFSIFTDNLYIGSYCMGAKTCVIKDPGDYKIDKNKKELPEGVGTHMVGQFVKRYCL